MIGGNVIISEFAPWLDVMNIERWTRSVFAAILACVPITSARLFGLLFPVRAVQGNDGFCVETHRNSVAFLGAKIIRSSGAIDIARKYVELFSASLAHAKQTVSACRPIGFLAALLGAVMPLSGFYLRCANVKGFFAVRACSELANLKVVNPVGAFTFGATFATRPYPGLCGFSATSFANSVNPIICFHECIVRRLCWKANGGVQWAG